MHTRTRVSILVLIGVFCCGLLFPVSAQYGGLVGRVELESKPVSNPQLAEVLNYGTFLDLEPPYPLRLHTPQLGLRLINVPNEGNCIPDTHGGCSHHYYLAVRSLQIGFTPVVYDLGEVGEIDDIEWLMPNQSTTAESHGYMRLRIRVTNFPLYSFDLNPELNRRERLYELEAGLDRLTVVQIQPEVPADDNEKLR